MLVIRAGTPLNIGLSSYLCLFKQLLKKIIDHYWEKWEENVVVLKDFSKGFQIFCSGWFVVETDILGLIFIPPLCKTLSIYNTGLCNLLKFFLCKREKWSICFRRIKWRKMWHLDPQSVKVWKLSLLPTNAFGMHFSSSDIYQVPICTWRHAKYCTIQIK